MRVVPLEAHPELLRVIPDVHEDGRGRFLEAWREERYAEAGIVDRFVQVNLSRSARGVLRGLHFQHPDDQAKLIGVVRGAVFDVAVDVRTGSPRFGEWAGVTLSDADHAQLYVPAGFAHGFAVLSEEADVLYACSAPYRPGSEAVLAWDDPDVGIEWPVEAPALSTKDAEGERLESLRVAGRLPAWERP